MFRALATIDCTYILSLCEPKHLFRLPGRKNAAGSNNFSHLFPCPRYPILHLGSIGPQQSKKRSAIGIELGGHRRGSC